MGCGHGWHDCGPWHEAPYGRGWYGPADWYEEADWPVRRTYRGARRDRATSTGEVEAMLDELQGEIRRLEAELIALRGAKEVAPGT
jgi:uncharacterized small protein (DUF1192 family)